MKPVGAPLRALWRDWRRGVIVSVAAGLLLGLLVGWLTPRGPLTTPEGLTTMALAFLVGFVAGLVMRSRWAMLVAPVAFVSAFELAHIGVSGPTVDGVQISTYGAIAFVVGRGLLGAVGVLPMVLGAALGAAAARRINEGPQIRQGRRRAGLYARRGVAAVVGALLIALAVGIARPADTNPIVGANGEPLAGSVAELTSAEIDGHELALMIRGASSDNPVLLFLAGGPGGTEMGAMREHLEALEEGFVVVTWDQRGTGKSYRELDPTSTLTLEQAVGDTIEVTNYLRDRFGQEQIYLMGQSWGSLLGVLAVQREPELYEAYIGTGQMVSPRETDRIFYQDTLDWARETGNEDLVETLIDIGPPPYDEILDYEPALSHEQDVYPYDRSENSEGEGGFSENLFVEEYTLLEQVHNLGAFLDTFSVLYPQIQDIDLRESATELGVPVYLIQGRHEARGRAVLAEEWFRQLSAPRKRLTFLDTSGHRPLFEQPEEFTQRMRNMVLDSSS